MLQWLKQLYWDIKYGPKRVFSIRKEGLDRVLEILGAQFRWRRRLTRYETLLYYTRFRDDLSEEDQRYYLNCQFQERLGRTINWDNPQTFNEKLQWLKLYYHNPLMTQCSNKVAVRDYVSQRIGEEYLVPVIGVYSSPDEIDFDALPDRFVLKVNWGSGQNIICKDKSTLNIAETKEQLRLWMQPQMNHYYNHFEWCYKNIVPKIICEQYIEQLDKNLLDYKFICFNGQPCFVWIDTDRFIEHKRIFYDLNWNRQPFGLQFPIDNRDYSKPENFDEMICFAQVLSNGFPFSRVDFYNLNGKIYFGEITFYSGAGYELFTPPEWDLKLGQMLQLPEKWI